MIGENIGAYTVLSELGRGGMGVVYLAEHRHLGRRAAIKFLVRECSDRPDVLGRFFTEARATSLIDHEGIVRVLDCDVHSTGNAYIVMEYLEGATLRAHLASRRKLPFPEAVGVMLRVCDALAAAHAKEIVHRDLKPDNIFLLRDPPGAIKIVDFGVAKLGGADAPTRTLSGTLLGTPVYMSPEQARGTGIVDARTDVYSLGCVLYEMVCGRPPFVHGGMGELIAAHLAQTPQAPESIEPSLPAGLCALIKRMLAKAPEERPSVAELITLLGTFSTGRATGFDTAIAGLAAPSSPSTLRYANGEVRALVRRRRAAMTVTTAAVIGALAYWQPWRRPAPPPPATPAVVERPAPAPPALPPAPLTPATAAVPATPLAPAPRVAPAARAQRTITVDLTSDPAGAVVCLARRRTRVATTNATFKLRSSPRPQTLVLYRFGFHLRKIEVPGDADSNRSVHLEPLGEDDLMEPPPCR